METNASRSIGALALVIGAAGAGLSGAAQAQDNVQELKEQINSLQKQIDVLRQRLDKVPETPPAVAAPAPAQAQAPAASSPPEFLERKAGPGVTFLTRGGEVSLYGNLDVSVESATKGIDGMTAANPPTTPPGNNGWMPAISSNISYVGIRGFQSLGDFPANFVYQLETQLDVSVTSGTPKQQQQQQQYRQGRAHLAQQLHRARLAAMGCFQDRKNRRTV
jgi:type II secretory pathway pseudopilin PulG